MCWHQPSFRTVCPTRLTTIFSTSLLRTLCLQTGLACSSLFPSCCFMSGLAFISPWSSHWTLTPLVAQCVPCVQRVCLILLAIMPSPAKHSGDVVTHHNKLWDTLAEACHRTHLNVKMEAGANINHDHSHSHPANILVPNWSLGKPAAFDLSVMSPLNSKHLLEAGQAA